MVVEQIAGGMVELRHGQLVIDLGCNETLLGLGQLVLGIQEEKYGFGSQFVFALVSMKRVSCKVPGDSGGFHGEFSLFESMNGIGNFQCDVLIGAALLILIT